MAIIGYGGKLTINGVPIEVQPPSRDLVSENEAGFIAALDERPDDWRLRLIYSDWLEEQGRLEEAACQRWMEEHRKWPGVWLNVQGEPRFTWWHEWVGHDSQHRLPDNLSSANFIYPTRFAAELALSQALAMRRQVAESGSHSVATTS